VDSGEWKNIIIDDWVPFNPKKNKIAFTKSAKGDAWVVLLEKAYAKLFGTYHIIQAGLEAEALRYLTGASTEYYKPEEEGHDQP